MYSSRKDRIVGFTACFASIYRLPNFTGATVLCPVWMCMLQNVCFASCTVKMKVGNVRVQICLGAPSFETVKYGTASPAKFYDPTSTLNQRGAGMATSPRFASTPVGAISPGPVYNLSLIHI